MCDHCKRPQSALNEELNDMEIEYTGSPNGAMRIKRVVTGTKQGMIAIGQEIEVNSITEDGVTKENKICVVYLTPDLFVQIAEFLMGGDDDG